MLVLSRRLHEKIVVPSLNLTVQVLAVKGATVRLGIEGPPGVIVLREELWEKQNAAEEDRLP